MDFWKWLYPGMGVKRWIFVIIVGVLIISAGLTFVVDIDVLGAAERELVHWLSRFTGWLPTGIASAIGISVIVSGFIFVGAGVRGTVRTVVDAAVPQDVDNLAALIYRKRNLEKGPKVVVIGGGTGLSNMLRGLKGMTSNITAIVTVADDGGSSGRLRTELGVLPPGDVRNTLVALADTESLMEQLFQYRFTTGDGLKGHTFGNLFIAAMSEITGDFEQAVRESSKVLAVRGQVLPATLDTIVLEAEFADGTKAVGETNVVAQKKPIRRIALHPSSPEPLPEALRALRDADIIVLGPGSLYTSVLPNLLVPGIADAVRQSDALRLYVSNVMTQPGETDGYRASDHVRVIIDHCGSGLFDYALVHRGRVAADSLARYRRQGAHPVAPDVRAIRALGVEPVARFIVSQSNLVRHDADLLAVSIDDLWHTHRTQLRRGRVGWQRRRPAFQRRGGG